MFSDSLNNEIMVGIRKQRRPQAFRRKAASKAYASFLQKSFVCSVSRYSSSLGFKSGAPNTWGAVLFIRSSKYLRTAQTNVSSVGIRKQRRATSFPEESCFESICFVSTEIVRLLRPRYSSSLGLDLIEQRLAHYLQIRREAAGEEHLPYPELNSYHCRLKMDGSL